MVVFVTLAWNNANFVPNFLYPSNTLFNKGKSVNIAITSIMLISFFHRIIGILLVI